MKLLVVLAAFVAVATAVCPLSRPLKIAMYPFIPDLAGDGWAGLATKLQNDFHTATGCSANLVFSWDINTYYPDTIVQALRPCGSPAVEPCGFDMAEIDTLVLDDLVKTSPQLIREMPQAVKDTVRDFLPQTRRMVRIDGVQWGQPSYSCDNLFMTYETGMQDVSNRRELLDWIDEKLAGNTSRIGYSADLWAVWDLTTAYVDAFLDTHPNLPLCCGVGTAYGPQVRAPIARGLADLAATCRDVPANFNPCLDGTFYNDPNRWFRDFISRRSVMIQGFSSYFSNIAELGGNINNIHVQTAILGQGSNGYLFTDAFVLSKDNCAVGTSTGSKCVDASSLWMNWQRLEGQITINLGKDLTPPRPRYLVSANENFYSDSRINPYRSVYDNFYNDDCDGTLQLARPLNEEKYTDKHCDLYANLASYVPTGSSCALQGYTNQH